MYESLFRECHSFHLFVFAFDDKCCDFLTRNNFPCLTVVSLNEFEDSELLAVKKTRSSGEYCWTCTPSIIRYVFNNYFVDNCTYLDADLYFFSSPQILIDEVGDNSIMITEHRYTKMYDMTETSGKYCVQFVFFRNDEKGRLALEWWRNACLEWCYSRVEDGKFGDQKYLDDWCTRFEGVCELQHLGGGVAPWNMQQYTFKKKNKKIYGTVNVTKKTFEVVFYHFHSLSFYTLKRFALNPYYSFYDRTVLKYILTPYIEHLLRIRRRYICVRKAECYKKKERHLRHSFYAKLYSFHAFLKSYLSPSY